MSNKSTLAGTGKTVKGAGWFVNLLSFVAVICIGIALILSKIGALSNVSGALMTIAQTVAYVVVSIVSFFYVYRKKNVWVWIIWAISIALIILSFIF